MADDSFIIDDHQRDEPAGFKKAKVGKTKGQELAWVKWAGLALVLVLGVWWGWSARGVGFDVKNSDAGTLLSVPSQKWSVTLPKDWVVERGLRKDELAAYPASEKDVRTAARNMTVMRIRWGAPDASATSAEKQFAKELVTSNGNGASVTDLPIPGGRIAKRAEEPSGKISYFVNNDPPLLVTIGKVLPGGDSIVTSLKNG